MALLKDTLQFDCVFRDLEPPMSSSILRKSTKISKPIRRVQLPQITLCHAGIQEKKGPSLGVICSGNPHQRIPYAPKFEDRFQEVTEKQERCARRAAWKLARNILKLKERDKAAFFPLTEEWCFPAPSVITPEETEFVVNSGASMHMLRRKDFISAELETARTSKSPNDGCNSQWRSANK